MAEVEVFRMAAAALTRRVIHNRVWRSGADRGAAAGGAEAGGVEVITGPRQTSRLASQLSKFLLKKPLRSVTHPASSGAGRQALHLDRELISRSVQLNAEENTCVVPCNTAIFSVV